MLGPIGDRSKILVRKEHTTNQPPHAFISKAHKSTTMAAPAPAFDAAALDTFWEDAGAMHLSNRTRVQLATKGIEFPADLDDFDEAAMEKIFYNLARPGKTIQGGRLRDTQPYQVTGKLKMRLLGAMRLVKFYKAINREIDPAGMEWPVIKNFLKQHEALKESKTKSSEDSSIPKISKVLPVHNWIQSTTNYVNRILGARVSGLGYVLRENTAVVVPAPARAVNEPYSEEYGSIDGDHFNRLSHSHALYKIDNGTVYDIIEHGTRGSDIAPTVAPWRKTRDGRSAMKAVIDQHEGVRVWDDLVKSAKEVLAGGRKWTGTTQFTTSQHCNVHRKAYIALVEAQDHVAVQIPDGRTRVTNLMDSFDTQIPEMLVALSSVRQDELNKRINFEAAAAFLIQSCTVTAKQAKKKEGVTWGPNVSGTQAGITPTKPTMGTTGVPLRYYKKEDFDKLTTPQKREVATWNKNNPSDNTGKKKKPKDDKVKSNKKLKLDISAMTARNEEMLEAMIASNDAQLKLWDTKETPGAGASQATLGSPMEEQIRANERARLAVVRLQAIQKGAAKPAGKPPVFPAP